MNNDLVQRYQEGYRSSTTAVNFGKGLRSFGLLAGIVVMIFGVVLGKPEAGGSWDIPIFLSLLVGGFLVGIGLVIAGTIISLQGRALRVALDNTVAGNPMLSPHEQAQAMEAGR